MPNYRTRMMQARDPRFATIANRLYGAEKPAKVAKKPEPKDELQELRAEYADVLGKRAYHGWDAETLKAKIAEAKA